MAIETLRTVLIIDTETTGVDLTAETIEIAAMLYNVDYASSVCAFSSLIRCVDNLAFEVNRIPQSLLDLAPEGRVVWPHIKQMADQAQVVLAHNADFDRAHVPAGLREKRWICTKTDLEWPRGGREPSLVNLTLAMGLGVSSAHRAMADVDMIARCLSRAADMDIKLEPFLRRGLRPKAIFEGRQGFDRNEEAKALGFRWDAGSKRWLRTMFIEDADKLPFAVRLVEKIER